MHLNGGKLLEVIAEMGKWIDYYLYFLDSGLCKGDARHFVKMCFVKNFVKYSP